MNCNECRKWWSPYLDSELDASTTFEVSEHLRACVDCRERFEREAYVEDWLREKLSKDAMPADLWASIREEVRGEQQSSRILRGPWRSRGALAASLLILMTAGVLFVDELGIRRESAGSGSTEAIVARQSVSDLLQDRRPSLVAFNEEASRDFEAQLAKLCRDHLNAQVTIDPSLSEHPIELLSATEEFDANGNPYVEIHVNCCGKPVLLAICPKGHVTCIEELCHVTGNCEKASRSGCPKSPPVETESVEMEGVMIAAATADHYLSGVLASVNVAPLSH